MADEEKDKITEAEGQSAAVAREGAPKENNAGTPSAVADNNANATATGNNPAGAKTGMEEIAQNPTNEYGEGVYFNGKMDKGTLNPEGAGLNERMAMASHPYHEPTPEEKEAEAKARNKNMRWAKLNDAIAAMSNLFFTSKYAPNAFDPNNLATKKLRERYDKIDADRDKDREAWWNARLAGRKQDQDEAENGRGWRYKYRQAQQQAQEKAADRASKERMNQVKYDTNIKIAEGQNASKERMNDANNATKVQQTKITTYGGKNYFEAYEPMADGTFKKHLYPSEEEALKHALGWGTAVEDWGEKITEDNSLMGGNKTERTLKLRPGLPEDKDHFSQRRTLPSGQ